MLDAELIDAIQKDVVRTFQEYEFFKKDSVRKQLQFVLYLWSKEHPLISYRQGMNEILGILVFVFFAEYTDDCEGHLEVVLDKKFLTADLYTMFTWVLDLGLKEMYGTNDDISQIKIAMESEKKRESDLFKFEHQKEMEEKERKEKIEEIFEAER